MATAPLSTDDALLAQLQAPPDLSEGTEALAYWRGRRERLPWYRVAARREAARMTVVWERRVRAALIQQRGLSVGMRLQAVRVISAVWFRRSTRRLFRTVAVLSVVALLITPALLVLDLLLHAI